MAMLMVVCVIGRIMQKPNAPESKPIMTATEPIMTATEPTIPAPDNPLFLMTALAGGFLLLVQGRSSHQ